MLFDYHYPPTLVGQLARIVRGHSEMPIFDTFETFHSAVAGRIFKNEVVLVVGFDDGNHAKVLTSKGAFGMISANLLRVV